ncbi:hypothetical protein G4B88_021792 [Cannabis sativa]|uniref:Uncharacterized protein n=1 Tax=Cannabis sativa TaxID=3483 RepID=A0A7J6F2T0_CANSA|nr:hypothetical protein G4B88_021792 [Cannabis sativa]
MVLFPEVGWPPSLSTAATRATSPGSLPILTSSGRSPHSLAPWSSSLSIDTMENRCCSREALVDFAVLIIELKRNFWSTKGMLASWKRLNYPHIAIGALASSAPILQFEDIAHVETFYDLISNGFKSTLLLFFRLCYLFQR